MTTLQHCSLLSSNPPGNLWDLRFLFNPPSFHNSTLQLQLSFPMPLSSTQCSPSLISTASSTTQAMKKAMKSFKKAVKNGVMAIAHPFEKCCTSSGSGTYAAGDSGAHLLFSCLPTPADRCILVSGRNSTRQTSVVDSDEEDKTQPVEETPKEELSTFWGLELLLIQVLIFALQNICKKPGDHLSTVSSRVTSRLIPIMAKSFISSSVPPSDAKPRGVAFAITKTCKIM